MRASGRGFTGQERILFPQDIGLARLELPPAFPGALSDHSHVQATNLYRQVLRGRKEAFS